MKKKIEISKIIGVLICVASIVGYFFILQGSSDHREQKKLIEKYYSSIQNGKYEDAYKCLSDETKNIITLEKFKDNSKKYIDGLKKQYGDNVKLSTKITSTQIYDNDRAKIEVEVKFYGDKDHKTLLQNIKLIKIDGKWYIDGL